MAAENQTPDGERVIDLPWVRQRLAYSQTKLSALQLLNWQMVSALESGELQPADASAAKVYGTETAIDVVAALLEVLGIGGILRLDLPEHCSPGTWSICIGMAS